MMTETKSLLLSSSSAWLASCLRELQRDLAGTRREGARAALLEAIEIVSAEVRRRRAEAEDGPRRAA